MGCLLPDLVDAPAMATDEALLMLRELMQGNGIRRTASGKLSPAEPPADVLVVADDEAESWQPRAAPREEQSLPGPSWLAEEWVGRDASVATVAATAPAHNSPTSRALLYPLPPVCGSAVDLPSSSAAAVLAASRLFRPQDEPLLQRFCKRLADEASLFPGRTLAGRQFRAGELLFSSGQRGDVLFVVAHGTVQVLRAAGPGQQERHGEYRGPGDLLGEMTVLGDGVHPTTARAVTDTMTLELRTATLSLLMQRFPHVTTRILDFVRSRATHAAPSLV